VVLIALPAIGLVLAIMVALVAAPVLASLELLGRRRSSRPPTRNRWRRRLRTTPTGNLIALVLVPLIVIGLWVTGIVLTSGGGS
jgi:hypothetical protein